MLKLLLLLLLFFVLMRYFFLKNDFLPVQWLEFSVSTKNVCYDLLFSYDDVIFVKYSIIFTDKEIIV